MINNKDFQNLENAVRDIMMQNNDLRAQEMAAQFQQANQQTPEEVEAAVQDNMVDTPDPVSEPENVDPETVIVGSSGVADGEAE
jgi:hypothetical protein